MCMKLQQLSQDNFPPPSPNFVLGLTKVFVYPIGHDGVYRSHYRSNFTPFDCELVML